MPRAHDLSTKLGYDEEAEAEGTQIENLLQAFLIYVYGRMYICASCHVTCMCCPQRPGEALDPLELKLHMVVISHVGVGNHKPEPSEEQPVLLQLSHLFSLLHVFLDLLFHSVANSRIYFY